MGRGLGELTALRGLPDPAVVLFALITQLGDAWFVFGTLSMLYWFGGRLAGRPGPTGLAGAFDRRRGAFLLALVLGGLGLTSGLKAFFALPRPPGADVPPPVGPIDGLPAIVRSVYENFSTADGYGFPSGHAVRSTLAWGGLALVLDIGPRTRRFAIAAVVVGLVALSRVVLGVHYAVDVLAGVAVGLAYLASVWRFVGPENPTPAFSLAVAIALGSVLVGGFERDPVAVLGAAVGARLAWGAIEGSLHDAAPSGRALAIAAAIGLPVFGGLFLVAATVETSPAVTFVATALALAGVLALPLAVDRLPAGQ